MASSGTAQGSGGEEFSDGFTGGRAVRAGGHASTLLV